MTINKLRYKTTSGFDDYTDSLPNITIITSSGGTVVLTYQSTTIQRITGTLNTTIILPNAWNLILGEDFEIDNVSSGYVTVKDFGNTTIEQITPGGYTVCRLVDKTTIAGAWEFQQEGPVFSDAISITSSNLIPTTIYNNLFFGANLIDGNAGLLSLYYSSSASPFNFVLLGIKGSQAIKIYAIGTVSTTIGTGTFIVDGGAGINGQLTVTNIVSNTSISTATLTASGAISGASITSATSTTTDTLIASGQITSNLLSGAPFVINSTALVNNLYVARAVLADTATSSGVIMSGDVTGTAAATTVVKIQNIPVVGSTPTTNQILVYNGVSWVPQDVPVTAGQAKVIYSTSVSSGVSTYNNETFTIPVGTQVDAAVNVSSITSPVFIKGFITAALGVTTIPAGLWILNTYAQASSASGCAIRTEVYSRTSGGTETLLFFNDGTVLSNNGFPELFAETVAHTSFSINATDRLVIKYYATNTGGTKTVTLSYDGTNHTTNIVTPFVGYFTSLDVAGNANILGSVTASSIVLPLGGGTLILSDCAIYALGTPADLHLTSHGGLGITIAATTGAITVPAATITGALTSATISTSSSSASSAVNTSSASTPIYTFLTPSLSNGNFSYIAVGVAQSTNNDATFIFNYTSSGSTSNHLNIGLFGVTGPLDVYNDHVNISTATITTLTSTNPTFKDSITITPTVALVNGTLYNDFIAGAAASLGNSTQIGFQYDSSGAATNHIRIGPWGQQGVSIYALNTASTSSSTGALVIEGSGGFGIGGKIFAGDNINTTGQLKSSLATGTAPITVNSATLVPVLYVARSQLADTVTTNANLTGVITSSGNVTSIASQTGTGTKFVVDTSPTIVTPNIVNAGSTSALISATFYTGNMPNAGSNNILIGKSSSLTDHGYIQYVHTADGSTSNLLGINMGNATFNLIATGATQLGTSALNITYLTASKALATDGSNNLVSVTNTGSGNNVLATNPTIDGPTILNTLTLSGTQMNLSTATNYFIDGTNASPANINIGFNSAKVAAQSYRVNVFNNSSDRTSLMSLRSGGSSSGLDEITFGAPIHQQTPNLGSGTQILGSFFNPGSVPVTNKFQLGYNNTSTNACVEIAHYADNVTANSDYATIGIIGQTPAVRITPSGSMPTQQILETISFTFTLTTTHSATANSTYTSNGIIYTVVNTISSSTTLVCTTSFWDSATSGTLTFSTGSGDATMVYNNVTQNTLTYTTPANVKYLIVGCVGGGGGGGGSFGSTISSSGGAGGGGGGYSEHIITSPSSTYTYAIGWGGWAGIILSDQSKDGGTTTFGSSLCSATGGQGAQLSGGTQSINGGTGGSGTAGNRIRITGSSGKSVQVTAVVGASNSWAVGGSGGAAYKTNQAASGIFNTSSANGGATGVRGGGGGGSTSDLGTSPTGHVSGGGFGGRGIIYVDEYYI